jgi:hypothetical protein
MRVRNVRLFAYPGVYEGGERLGPAEGVCSLLFGYLVLHRGSAVSERRLAEAVWGYGGTSHSALRSAVSRLRPWGAGLFGDAFDLRHTGGGYRLDLAGVPVDLDALGGGGGRGGGSPTGDTFDHLLARSACVCGVFLDGTPSHFRHACGENAVHAKISALSVSLSDAATTAAAHARALPEIRRLAVIMDYDPLVRAALVRLLDRMGLRYEAVEAQRAALAMCRKQLRLSPPAILLQALSSRAHIVEEPEIAPHGMPGPSPGLSPSPGHGPAPVLPAALPLPRPPVFFVGRRREREAIADWARAGGTAAYIVTGMPGIGKSALLRSAVAEFAQLRTAIWVDADDGMTLADLVRMILCQLTVSPQDTPDRLVDGQLLLRRLISLSGTIVCVDGLRDASVIAPLLPSLPLRTLLVTSRQLPAPMEDATVLRLGELSAGESLEFATTFSEPGTWPSWPFSDDAVAVPYQSVGGHPGALRAIVSRAGLLRRIDDAEMLRIAVRTFLGHIDADVMSAVDAMAGEVRGAVSRVSERGGPDGTVLLTLTRSITALVAAERLVRNCLATYAEGNGGASDLTLAVSPLVALLLQDTSDRTMRTVESEVL